MNEFSEEVKNAYYYFFKVQESFQTLLKKADKVLQENSDHRAEVIVATKEAVQHAYDDFKRDRLHILARDDLKLRLHNLGRLHLISNQITPEEFKYIEEELIENLKNLYESCKLEVETYHREIWNLHMKALKVKFDADIGRQDHMDEIEQIKREEKHIEELVQSMELPQACYDHIHGYYETKLSEWQLKIASVQDKVNPSVVDLTDVQQIQDEDIHARNESFSDELIALASRNPVALKEEEQEEPVQEEQVQEEPEEQVQEEQSGEEHSEDEQSQDD